MDVISIVIPVYNHKKELQKALTSIERQTYPSIEVIIVDDGSDVPIKKKNLDTDLSVNIHRQGNKGAPAARNKGLSIAKGDFIMFWDADVIGNKEMLEKMKKNLEENPDSSFAYSNFYLGSKKMPAQEFDPEALKENNFIHSTSLIRSKDAIKWDETLERFQDWDLWLSMMEQGKKGTWIDEYLFKVNPRSGRISGWLPKFAYKVPWCYIPVIRGKVKNYNQKKEKVLKKHGIKN